ncbi:restriction endonuclease [Trichothermofontia sp.]
MLPLLHLAADRQEHSLRDAIEQLADQFALTTDECQALLPSGRQATFDNRVGWARTYLKKAGLLRSTKRGYFQITDRGYEILASNPAEINIKFLQQFEEFITFRVASRKEKDEEQPPNSLIPAAQGTPEEELENAFQKLNENLATELLQTIKDCSPAFFERLVVDLLVAMGYGGTRKDAGQTIGRSGDGGIDGVIKEDRLGLDVIYVQAKRWDDPVGRPEIQKFAGALQGVRAKKGVFITTSSFTNEARDFVSRIDNKIVLVDGAMMAQFMIEHNVGVAIVQTYAIKRIDSDYFTNG